MKVSRLSVLATPADFLSFASLIAASVVDVDLRVVVVFILEKCKWLI